MGHYWSEMRGSETQQERDHAEINKLVKTLRKMPSSHFSVDELALLLNIKWSVSQENYSVDQCAQIREIANREGAYHE